MLNSHSLLIYCLYYVPDKKRVNMFLKILRPINNAPDFTSEAGIALEDG